MSNDRADALEVRNGGNAFPTRFAIESGSYDPIKQRVVPQGTTEVYIHMGMSLRDWFAGQALPGVIAAHADGSGALSLQEIDAIAKDASAIADAMLRERAKEAK